MVSGTYVSIFDVSDELKHQIGYFNVSITTLLIPIFIWRVYHRILYAKVPKYESLLTEKDLKIAHFFHMLIYILIAHVLITGVLMMKQDFPVFGLIMVTHPINNPGWQHFFEVAHIVFNRTLGVIVLLHILAVIKHELHHVNILRRMM